MTDDTGQPTVDRKPGWYWVRVFEGAPWHPYHWYHSRDGEAFWIGRAADDKPMAEIGKRIPRPDERPALADLPDCMMPDGGDPCGGFLAEYGQRMKADARLSRIAGIIEVVENRCMAMDGPVSPTLSEMTDGDLRAIYQLAKGDA